MHACRKLVELQCILLYSDQCVNFLNAAVILWDLCVMSVFGSFFFFLLKSRPVSTFGQMTAGMTSNPHNDAELEEVRALFH